MRRPHDWDEVSGSDEWYEVGGIESVVVEVVGSQKRCRSLRRIGTWKRGDSSKSGGAAQGKPYAIHALVSRQARCEVTRFSALRHLKLFSFDLQSQASSTTLN